MFYTILYVLAVWFATSYKLLASTETKTFRCSFVVSETL